MKKVGLFLVSLFALIFTACNFDLDEIIRESELEYITVDTSSAEFKKIYLLNEEFDPTGLRVIGHYTDETEKDEDIRVVEFSGFSSEEICENLAITADLYGKKCVFQVAIDEALIDSIIVATRPEKLFYKKGEVFDPTGMVVLLKYSNGKTSVLTQDDYVVSGFDSSNSANYGSQLLLVSYAKDETIHTDLIIKLVDFEVTALSIDKYPNKLVYIAGKEDFDSSGMILNATLSTGEVTTIDDYNIEPEDFKTLEVSKNQEVKITVNGISVSFFIEIVDANFIGASIVNKNDIPILFYKSEDLNVSDTFKFKKLMSNNEVRDDINISTMVTEADAQGDKSISHLRYSYNKKVDFDDPEAKEINDTSKLSWTGIQTIYFYYKFYDIQTNEITIYNFDYNICVADSKLDRIEANFDYKNNFTSIPLEKEPNPKEENKYGTWTITGILKDETTVDIPCECCSFKFEDSITSDIIYNEIKKSQISSYSSKIIIEYYDTRQDTRFSTAHSITYTNPKLTEVLITKLPNKLDYAEGEILNIYGIEYKKVYSNGTIVFFSADEASKENITILNENGENIDNTPLVRYNYVTLKFTDEVKATISITVHDNYTKGIQITTKEISNQHSNYKFRKGETYSNESFLSLFDIQKTKVAGEPCKLTDDEKNNLSFKINYDEKIIYVVYKENNNYFYTQFDNITVLDPVPVNVTIIPNIGDTLNNRMEKGTYTIYYKDGSKDTKSYEDIRGNLSISEGTIKYNYIDTNRDSLNNKASYTQIVDSIAALTISKKEKNSYIRGENVDYSNYFDINVIYSSEPDKKYKCDNSMYEYVTPDINNNVDEDSNCTVTVILIANKKIQSSSYITVKPKIVNIEILDKKNNYINYSYIYPNQNIVDAANKIMKDYVNYRVTYKDKNDNDKNFIYNYSELLNKGISVKYNGSKFVFSKDDIDLPSTTFQIRDNKINNYFIEWNNTPTPSCTLQSIKNSLEQYIKIGYSLEQVTYDRNTQIIDMSKKTDIMYRYNKVSNNYQFKLKFNEIETEYISCFLSDTEVTNDWTKLYQ